MLPEGLGGKLYTALYARSVHRCSSYAREGDAAMRSVSVGDGQHGLLETRELSAAILPVQPPQRATMPQHCGGRHRSSLCLPTTWGPALAGFVGTRLPPPSHKLVTCWTPRLRYPLDTKAPLPAGHCKKEPLCTASHCVVLCLPTNLYVRDDLAALSFLRTFSRTR